MTKRKSVTAEKRKSRKRSSRPKTVLKDIAVRGEKVKGGGDTLSVSSVGLSPHGGIGGVVLGPVGPGPRG